MTLSVRALVFSSLLACILVSFSRAATVSEECAARKAACEATCRDRNAVSDFKCDEQNGAISSSCACAMPGSSSSSSSSSSGSSSNSGTPTPAQGTTDTAVPAATTCQEKSQACTASCPEGTSAKFDCKEDETKAASASADSCVCSPVDASATTPTTPPTAPSPSQGTTIAPVNGGTDPEATLSAGGLPARTTGSQTAPTVVNAGYKNNAWKVLAGSLFGAAMLVAL